MHVVGARPNFMKVAPVMAAFATYAHVTQTLLHTGQHYDANMSEIFFRQLGLPKPDINLEVGSGSHAVQTAQIMMRFEEVVVAQRPDWVLVYGDVNSTVAATLVCAKLGIRVAHVEAGLRSFDRTMPEELNRLMTDQIADLLLTPSVDGDENLKREGVSAERIHCVGNVMIDTLIRLRSQAQTLWATLQERFALERYALVTLHRPSNVDDPTTLAEIMSALTNISQQLPVVFPVHPRTRQKLEDAGFGRHTPQFQLLDPLGYLEFLALQEHATVVLTDSGGVQEETSYLHVPCLTLRENTERPVTVTIGTNTLVGKDMDLLQREVMRVLAGEYRQGAIPPLWDGHAGQRIADILAA